MLTKYTDTERAVRQLYCFNSHRLYYHLRDLPLLLQNVSLVNRTRHPLTLYFNSSANFSA